MSKQKVLIIVGPTASGKTSLSITLARKFGGEVISADSRQVYKGLDLGTGKVTLEEMMGVQHHLLDIKKPNDEYSAADFVIDADNAIRDIRNRGNLPIIAGGTFLYVDALLGRVSMPEVPPNENLRTELEQKTTDELYKMLQKSDPNRASNIDKHNPRRLIRALEIVDALGKVPEQKSEKKYEYLILGLEVRKEQLQKNIQKRLDKRIELGMIEEVISLLEDSLSNKHLETLGIEYKYISEFLSGTIDMTMMKQHIKTKSWQFAKRQLTWLKRDEEIHWIRPNELAKAEDLVTGFLKK